MTMNRARILATATALALALTAGAAAASDWCGENGLIRFSFVEGDSLVSVLFAEPGADGVTRVSLWVWLADVEPVKRNGEALLTVGAAEFALQVDGAEVFVTGRELPGLTLNVAPDQFGVLTGYNPNLRLADGRTLLARFDLMFQGRPGNVRFSIRPEGIHSCKTMPACPGSGTRALWVGPSDSDNLAGIFGAGCVPAWLNPTGEPDQTPERGNSGWRDVGLFEPR